MNSQDDHFDELMRRYLQGMASMQEAAQLDAILEKSPEFRRLFLAMSNLDAALEVEAAEAAVSLSAPAVAGSWKAWARTAAAVALLFCGAVLGAGVAWAMVPRIRDQVGDMYDIVRTGFERIGDVEAAAPDAVRNNRVPRTAEAYGQWRADRVRIATAEGGVTPFEGHGMLAFEQAVGPVHFEGGPPNSCDLYRLVDLAPFHDQIADGKSIITLSARFKDASDQHETPTLFVTRIRIFSKPPEQVTGYPHDVSALGYNVIRTHGGEQGREWHALSATTTVPSDAVFAMIHIAATRPEGSPNDGPATFDRHYCDDVRLSFRSPTGDPTP